MKKKDVIIDLNLFYLKEKSLNLADSSDDGLDELEPLKTPSSENKIIYLHKRK